MNGIPRCKICNFHEARHQLSTVLGTNPVCFECIEHNAERPVDVHNCLLRTERLPRDHPAHASTMKYLASVHYWMGPVEGYLDIRSWNERVSRQMPTIVQQTEDDAIAERMAKRLSEVRRNADKRKQKPRKRWFQQFLDLIDFLRYCGKVAFPL